MANELLDVSGGDLITAQRQNDINMYIEHGTHAITTLSLDSGSGEIKSTGNFTDGTNSVTAAQMKSAYDGIIVPQIETKSGNDCSGLDGESNRIITLANTPATMFLVVCGGQALNLTSDYSINGDEITFLNSIFDSMNITLLYFT